MVASPNRSSLPQLQVLPGLRHRFRYAGTNPAALGTVVGSTIAIAYNSLLALMSAGSVTNSQVAGLFQSFRIRRVEAWCTSQTLTSGSYSTNVPASVTLEWPRQNTGAFGTKDVVITDTSLDVAHPAHIVTQPPKGSFQDVWGTTSSGFNYFTLSWPGGYYLVVDIDIEFQFDDNATGSALGQVATISVATAKTGALYYMALDCAGSSYLPPVGLPTTK